MTKTKIFTKFPPALAQLTPGASYMSLKTVEMILLLCLSEVHCYCLNTSCGSLQTDKGFMKIVNDFRSRIGDCLYQSQNS